jgi:hypothetical protein
MENKYIYKNENSISKSLCQDIINLFELEENKREGRIFAGINKQIKDTTDYTINSDDPKWNGHHDFLYDELNMNLDKYLKELNKNKIVNNDNQLSDKVFNFFDKKTFIVKDIIIKRYIKNTGKYIYHNDFAIDFSNSMFRVVTFLWYLNDVTEGGETVFDGTTFIKPTAGKLILFPANWTYPHCGKIPISSNKYIITGWIYVKMGGDANNENISHECIIKLFKNPNKIMNEEIIKINRIIEEQNKINIFLKNIFVQRVFYDGIYSKNVCDWMIMECEEYARKNNGWNSYSHISIDKISSIFNFCLFSFNDIFNKIIKSYCLTDSAKFSILDIFIAKNGVDLINDKSVITINIQLNDNEDGGVQFEDGITTFLKQGDLIVYSGKSKNANIPNKKQYMLIAFVYVTLSKI